MLYILTAVSALLFLLVLYQFKKLGRLQAQREQALTAVKIVKAQFAEYKKAKAKEDEIQAKPVAGSIADALDRL